MKNQIRKAFLKLTGNRRSFLARSLKLYRRIRYRKIKKIMITGTKGKTTTTRMVAAIMMDAGYRVGFSCTDGVYINGQLVENGDRAGWSGASKILPNPNINCAVLETARGGLLKHGLYVDRCHAAAFLNVDWDHVGEDGIETLEQMRDVKRQVTDASSGRVILNAEDRRVRQLVTRYGLPRTTLFSTDPDEIVEHCDNGGEALTLAGSDRQNIVHLRGGMVSEIMRVDAIPATLGGKVSFNVSNALAAISLALAVGVQPEKIKTALSRFDLTMEKSSGRFNVIFGYPFDLVIDRANNVSSLAGFASAMPAFQSSGFKRCMLSAVGNRPDWTFQRMAELAVEAGFTHFVVYENENLRRRRESGEIPARLRDALVNNGVERDRITSVIDPLEGMEAMAAEALPGDLLAFLGLSAETYLPFIRRALEQHGYCPELERR